MEWPCCVGAARWISLSRTVPWRGCTRVALSDGKIVDAGPLAKSGWTRQLESIQRIAARLTRLASVDEVATTMCNEIRQLIGHDEAHVLIVDDTSVLRPAASIGPSGNSTLPPLPTDGPGALEIGRALRSGVATLAPKIASMGAGRTGPHSMLVVPLHYECRVSGLICLIARGAGRFDDDDLRLIQILSDQAAVAIENARLLQGRDKLVTSWRGLLEISQAAGSAQDERTIAALLAASRCASRRAPTARSLRAGTRARRSCAPWSRRHERRQPDDRRCRLAARRQALRDGKPVVIQAEATDYVMEAASCARPARNCCCSAIERRWPDDRA